MDKRKTKTRKPKTRKRKAASPAPGLIGAMKIERVRIGRIKAAPYNPRKDLKPGDPEYEKLRRSIEEFGYVDPLIWNKRTGTLVGGHQRLKILVNEHGATEVDVSVVDLDDTAERALNVTLNKVAGVWDDPALAKLLLELQEDVDADVSTTGFDEKEIDRLLAAHDLLANPDTSPKLGELEYRVIVDCKNENHQKELLKRFAAEGLSCRTLIS